MTEKNKHFDKKAYDDLHSQDPKNRGCISRHGSGATYNENNRCSYRWQAYKQAEKDKVIYDGHPDHVDYKKFPVGGKGTTFYMQNTINNISKGGGFTNLTGKSNISEITKGKRKGQQKETFEVEVKNFQTGSVPYPNNAHHVLPNGALRQAITEAVKLVLGEPNEEVEWAIKVKLIEKKYNLNDQSNMIILALTGPKACLIGLPAHLKTKKHRDHNIYSKDLQTLATRRIKNNYKQDKKKHPTDDEIGKMKDALVKLSEFFYGILTMASSRQFIFKECAIKNTADNRRQLVSLDNTLRRLV